MSAKAHGRLYGLLRGLVSSENRRAFLISLFLMLGYAAIPAAEVLSKTFFKPFPVQDDARQFLFWMQHWREPTVLVNDTVTKCFRTVTPYRFKAMYYCLTEWDCPPSPSIRVRTAHFVGCRQRYNQQRPLAEKVDH